MRTDFSGHNRRLSFEDNADKRAINHDWVVVSGDGLIAPDDYEDASQEEEHEASRVVPRSATRQSYEESFDDCSED